MSKDQEFDYLVTSKDHVQRYSTRKQRAINKLLCLTSRGIPAIYSKLPREQLLLVCNVLLFRALHGFYDNKQVESMVEYQSEALNAFESLRSCANRVLAGGTISNTVVKANNKRGTTFYSPLQVFRHVVDDCEPYKSMTPKQPPFEDTMAEITAAILELDHPNYH